jgi:hypothetical protein
MLPEFDGRFGESGLRGVSVAFGRMQVGRPPELLSDPYGRGDFFLEFIGLGPPGIQFGFELAESIQRISIRAPHGPAISQKPKRNRNLAPILPPPVTPSM